MESVIAKKRLLLIDDEARVRASLKMVLEPLYDIAQASDGPEGLDIFRKEVPDLVLLDIVLPGTDGLAVLQTLRTERKSTPVIMLTGTKSVKTAVDAMKLGAADYLSKPFDVDELRIANRANELIAGGNRDVKRGEASGVETYDFRGAYVADLKNIIDMDAIAKAGLHIGADPLGGASVNYWKAIAETYGLDLTVVNPEVDPRWAFMTLDWDGKIRMDPSSPSAMASVLAHQHDYDILTGNDADADRHGIVTPDGGLMNPNHYLAVAIQYLYTHRPQWRSDAAIGKTLVSSSMIDRVAAHLGRRLWEVPVGFKWFVPGLVDGSVAFGGEESAGASFLRLDGTAWTTDKDGILLALLASEILAVTGKTPSQLYAELVAEFGDPAYERVDAAASPEQKARLGKLSGAAITATELAGDPITAKLSEAPGNGAAVGGVKVTTEFAWFAARPSGTEDVYKIYAESFRGPEHLKLVQAEAKSIVDAALGG